MTTEQLEKNLYEVAEYAFEHAEILKAKQLIDASPIPIQDSTRLAELRKRIVDRIDHIYTFQNTVRKDSGFVDPPDVRKKACYVELKAQLKKHEDIYTLIDIGCFTGWVGRNLSIWGYKVHGVDLDPDTINRANYLASGTIATFEVLEGTQVGLKYPGIYDGAIMFDVVEHVFDHHVLLSSAELAVRKNGYIFINLPRYITERELLRGNTPDMVKEHLRSYSEKEVQEIFGGRKNLQIKELNDPEDPSWFISYQK